MVDYKRLRQTLKETYTQQNVAQILSFIGYDISRSYKFKLREETTPSASISKTGTITDFGSGWSGDLVAVLYDYKGTSLSEATIYVAKLLNIDIREFSK